ncbi:MAG: PKD domain-containing protein [Saprospiraceae bacterium]
MSTRLHLFACFFLLLLAPSLLSAQQFAGQSETFISPALLKQFYAWEIYRIDANAVNQFVKASPDSELHLELGPHSWRLSLTPNDRLLAPNYKLQVLTPEGLVISYPKEKKAYRGYELNTGGQARMTFDKDFIYGYVMVGDKMFFIEPLRFVSEGADKDLYLVYEKDQVNYDAIQGTCAALDLEDKSSTLFPQEDDGHDHNKDAPEMMACYELDLAIASDKSMFNKYGSVGAVEAHNIAVINNVEGDYTGNFNHDVQFVIVTQFVVTGNDPWTNSNEAGELLLSFRNWGNAGNFGVAFDLGELWTNRNFNGGTIGIAYLNGLCNNNRYHCLQDFSNNAQLLRCLTSHEIGHNLSCTHDPTNGSCPPNFIMCPFVSTSSTWSNQSVNQINNYLVPPRVGPNSSCMTPCNAGPPLSADFTWDPNPACAQTPVQFTDLSVGNIISRQWVFQGGSPPNSSQQNPVVQWANGGTYNVTLTVNGPNGASASTTQAVTIIGQPIANFTSSVNGTTVTFTNQSVNADSYFWDFGDGNVSLEQNPVHTYAVGGVYTVTLTVTNACNTVTTTRVINTAPTANFSASPTSGCATLTVVFTNESSNNATTYLWQFPGGTPATSTLANPVVNYSTSGTFSVTLTAFNPVGNNVITKTNYITVSNVPNANFNFTVNNQTVQFNNTSNNATSFTWDFGDGNTSNEQNPAHTYSQGGTFTVTLTATNDCGSTTSTKTVTVVAAPTANFSANVTTGCGPLTVQFNNLSTGNPIAFEWTFQGGMPEASFEENPLVVFSAPGTYTVSLTAVNAFGSNTFTQTNYITVLGLPGAGFGVATNGFEASFTNSSNNAASFSWDFGDGSGSTQQNPTHTYAQDGVYTVVLIATNACGSDTAVQTVTIVTPPTAGFSANGTSGCAPFTVQFVNESSENATSFQWSFPGGDPATSNAENPTVTYNAAGVYSVTLIAGNPAGADTLELVNYISVGAGPVAGFGFATNGFEASFTNSSNNAASFSWDFGDGSGSTQQNPTHTYAQDGVYTVVLIATNACGSDTAVQTVTIVTPPTAGFSANGTSGCAPFTVQFVNESSENATSFQWSFPGGDPATSNAENPTVTYNAAGVYSVTLIAGNPAGADTLELVNYVQVGGLPIANFSSSVSGATAQFTNLSVNADSYSWDFGDGNSSSEQNPVHTYDADGVYLATLTVVNACGEATYSQNVVIITSPGAGFSANNTTGCPELTVQFFDLSSNNTTGWLWSFPGGDPASSDVQNPVVSYNTPGVYDVQLIAFNPVGSDTFTQTNFINVLSPPLAGFNATVNNATVSFSNTTQFGATFLWNFGDGKVSNAVNPTHTYTQDGVYTVTLTATNNCGTSTATQTITIITPPVAGIGAGATTICAGESLQFSNASSPNATTFEWTFEGGAPATSNEANPLVVWNTPGVYQVTLVASNPAGSSTANTTITVLGLPGANFTALAVGYSVIFTNLSQNATTYQWDFGDGNTSTEPSPAHTYAGPGVYAVKLKASNDCGSAEIIQTVEVVGAPPVAAFTSSEQTGCFPFTVQFTDLSAGDPVFWNWTFEGGSPANSGEQNPTVTYMTPGVYSVTLEVTNAFGGNSVTQSGYITVLGLPTAAFTYSANAGGTVSFTNNSQGGNSFSWDFGDGNTSSEVNPTHTYAQSGTYVVKLTVSNQCGASTLEQMVEVIIVSAKTPQWAEKLIVYPNPNDGRFVVELLGAPRKDLELCLFSALGQRIDCEILAFETGYLVRPYNLTQLPSGLYTLRIGDGQQNITTLIVVE